MGSRSESLIRKPAGSSDRTYLVKLPQWIAEAVNKVETGTEIGFSHDIEDAIGAPASGNDDIRLVLTSAPGDGRSNRPSEYGLTIPGAGHQAIRVFETFSGRSDMSAVSTTVHVIPRRDEKYTALLRDRLGQADTSKQHRTLHNEEDYAKSRMSVKLFQRHGETSSPDVGGGTPESAMNASSRSKKIRGLDEMPQMERRSMALVGGKTLDDVLMGVLVENDDGWPLQQLMRTVKDRGVVASMSQMKAKLLEICVYQRRNDDTHPKYYLKSEYK